MQDLDSKKIIGLYVAEKKMVSELSKIYQNQYHLYYQVRYSGEMEPYCAKTVLLQLTHELGLHIDSITTDRSTTMRSMIRWGLA